MSDLADLVKLIHQQMETQKQKMETQKEQMEMQKNQMDMQRIEFAKQMDALNNRLGTAAPAASVPSFASFDSTS